MSTPNDTVSLEDATTWCENWRNANPNKVKAFLIPTDDLSGVLAENPDKVRAYLAIKDKPDGSQETKLVFVGAERQANGDYKDMLPNPAGQRDNGQYIFDLTEPCPIYCDPTSQLNSNQQ